MHLYEVRPRTDKRGVDLICDALPFGRLWYGEPNAASNAIGYAKFFSRSPDAVIRVRASFGELFDAKADPFVLASSEVKRSFKRSGSLVVAK